MRMAAGLRGALYSISSVLEPSGFLEGPTPAVSMRWTLLAFVAMVPLAGCAGDSNPCDGKANLTAGADGVVTVTIHIGWSQDRQSQYMTPDTVCVAKDSKVRFIVHNDDQASVDYPGPGKNNFHDVALLQYNGVNYEHEAYAGKPPVTTCADGDGASPVPNCKQTYFVASTAGTFRLICEVRIGDDTGGPGHDTHDALGMHATFVVR